jgi:hypothetical protein
VAFERDLWDDRFSPRDVPAFPCPNCSKGILKYDSKQFWRVEPQYSLDGHKHEDWEPWWVTERFTMFLKCGAAKCGEVVVVSGSTSLEEVQDDEFGWAFESLLVPVLMTPPPPIIQVPEKTPKAVQEELQLAFQLFWSDLGASATKIRTSVDG